MNQRIKHTSKRLIVAFAALVFANKTASATTVSYTSNFSTTSSTFTSPLNLQQFNPALGTLTSLSVTLLANVNGSAQITNNNASAQVYSVVLSSALALIDPLNNTLAAAAPRFASSVRVAGNGGYSIGASASDSQANSYSDTPTLSEFIGTTNFTGNLTGTDLSGFSGPGQTVFNSSASTYGSVGVTYTYIVNTPAAATAPEAATMLSVVFGLSGLAVVKLRSS